MYLLVVIVVVVIIVVDVVDDDNNGISKGLDEGQKWENGERAVAAIFSFKRYFMILPH